jgi:two-component system repressor protein LuxO
MSGIDLLHHLKARNCKVPVIFITAHGSDEVARAEAASDKTVGYLIKPLDADELLDAVDRALGHSKQNH